MYDDLNRHMYCEQVDLHLTKEPQDERAMGQIFDILNTHCGLGQSRGHACLRVG